VYRAGLRILYVLNAEKMMTDPIFFSEENVFFSKM
jgi:hypothetical protein